MSEDGIVVITIPIKKGTNKIIGEPEIISRGFVFMKASEGLIAEAKKIVQRDLPVERKVQDWKKVRIKIEKDLVQFFFKETAREPMVLPVIVKV